MLATPGSGNHLKCSRSGLDWFDNNLSAFKFLKIDPAPHNHEKISQINAILTIKPLVKSKYLQL